MMSYADTTWSSQTPSSWLEQTLLQEVSVRIICHFALACGGDLQCIPGPANIWCDVICLLLLSPPTIKVGVVSRVSLNFILKMWSP